MQRLLVDTGGDLARAHELFEWNVHAAGAAMEAIHVFELILRNAIDRELRIWNDAMAGTPDWALRPHPYLLRALNQTELANAVTRARRIAAEHGRPLCHDDVLAQMSLGTWRYILPSKANKSKQKLWAIRAISSPSVSAINPWSRFIFDRPRRLAPGSKMYPFAVFTEHAEDLDRAAAR